MGAAKLLYRFWRQAEPLFILYLHSPFRWWCVSRSQLDNTLGVRLFTDQEAAAEIPLVLPSKRGLRHHTGQPKTKTPPPSGGGASCVHGSKTLRTPVSVSIYFCSLSLYLNVLWRFLLIHSYLWYVFFILYHFFSLDYSYFYYMYIVIASYLRLYFSFNTLLTLVPPYRVTIFWPSGRPKKVDPFRTRALGTHSTAFRATCTHYFNNFMAHYL